MFRKLLILEGWVLLWSEVKEKFLLHFRRGILDLLELILALPCDYATEDQVQEMYLPFDLEAALFVWFWKFTLE